MRWSLNPYKRPTEHRSRMSISHVRISTNGERPDDQTLTETAGNDSARKDAQPLSNFTEDFNVRIRAARALWMYAIRIDPATKLEELGGGMLVCRRGATEREAAKVLQLVVQFVEPRIAAQPIMVP